MAPSSCHKAGLDSSVHAVLSGYLSSAWFAMDLNESVCTHAQGPSAGSNLADVAFTYAMASVLTIYFEQLNAEGILVQLSFQNQCNLLFE